MKKKIPINVMNKDRKNAYTKQLQEYIEAAILLLDPNEFAIKELHPATIPIPAEIIIKYKGKAFAKAAKASGDIFPA